VFRCPHNGCDQEWLDKIEFGLKPPCLQLVNSGG
jgi:hypothetical protein